MKCSASIQHRYCKRSVHNLRPKGQPIGLPKIRRNRPKLTRRRRVTLPDLQPVLRGQLLHLRPLRSDDFDALFAVAADPLIWEQHPARDRYQPEVFRAFFDEAMASGGALIATDSRDGKVIGGSRYHGYNADQSEIEIGWTFLARAYWGGKYNGEMKELMLRHAFTFVDRIIFLIGPENYRSQRAVEKIGAVPAGTRIDGYGKERLAFEITAAMFDGSSRAIRSRSEAQ
jgi:RimJ/RimL family protein N-acetyltransferase